MKPRYKLYIYFSDFISVIFSSLSFNKYEKITHAETKLKNFLNTENFLLINQARIGVYLAVKAIIKKTNKSEILLSPYTIADVINMVLLAGGKPIFVDINKDTLNIDESLIEKKISSDTAAILVTHLHGLVCEMEKILTIANKYDLYTIEDAAQSFGAKDLNLYAGSIGDVGIYSFGLYKNLSSFYGGGLVSKDIELFSEIKAEHEKFSNFKNIWYLKKVFKALITNLATSKLLFRFVVLPIIKLGYFKNIKFINRFVETELDISRKRTLPSHYKTRPSLAQAMLLSKKLKNVVLDNEVRIKFAKLYFENLKNIKTIHISQNNGAERNIYTYFPIYVEDMEELRNFLIKNNVDVGPQHYKNTASLNSFKDYYSDCPVAEKVSKSVLLLPTYPRYTEDNINKVINLIKEFYGV